MLTEAAARADVSMTFSVPTVDDDIRRATEPGTAPPRQRLRALTTLVEAGVRAGVGMAPILPGLSEHPTELARVVEAAREAGACGVWASLLHQRPGTRERFLECLAREWPELLPEYERLYARGAHLRTADAEPARQEVRRLARLHGIRDRRPEPLQPPPRPEQLSLLSA